MEQEFTTSTGWKIFYGAVALAITIFALLIFNTDHSKTGNGILIIPILMLCFAAFILYNFYKRKVTVSSDGIAYTSIYGIKELLKANVKGFRIDEKVITIEPSVEGYPKISIRNYKSIGDYKDLMEWLKNNYTNLNQVEYDEEKNQLLNDLSLGATQLDREANLKRAVLYTQIYTFTGMGTLFLILYLHPANKLLPIALLFYPFIGILLLVYSKGIIRMYNKKNSPYPSIAVGILFPCIALIMLATFNTRILVYTNFWLPFIVAGVIIFSLLFAIISKRATASLNGDIVFALLIALSYAGGGILEVNCCFDSSNPQVYKATVTDHYISHGKSTTYHLNLSDWGPYHISGNITVPESFYEKVAVNEVIHVDLKKGVLNIPWYYLSI